MLFICLAQAIQFFIDTTDSTNGGSISASEYVTWTTITYSDCTVTTYLGELDFSTSTYIKVPNTIPGALISYDETAEQYQRVRIIGSAVSDTEDTLEDVTYSPKEMQTTNSIGLTDITGTDYLTITCTDNTNVETLTVPIGINGGWAPPSCPNNCNDKGNCHPIDGTCECVYPYQGTECSETDCGTCFNGSTCNTSTGICACETGSYGDHCEFLDCLDDCSSHGVCDRYTGICHCYDGFTDENCSEIRCLNDCNSNGKCDYTTGTCTCYDNYYGFDCAYKRCPRDCGAFGGCDLTTGKCMCSGNYGEDDCMFTTCPNNCSSEGTCDEYTGLCECKDEYAGVDCSLTRT